MAAVMPPHDEALAMAGARLARLEPADGGEAIRVPGARGNVDESALFQEVGRPTRPRHDALLSSLGR